MNKTAGFDGDEGNRVKCRMHGVTLDEVEDVFRRAPLVLPDRTGAAEIRFNAVGLTAQNRHVFVVYTMRNQRIRPISARYMHRKEIDAYERSRKA